MDPSTRHLRTRRRTHRYHADPAFDQVLAVFFDQGSRRLAPSFVAYELDLTTRAAENLLDEMVKHSLLELDFDDNGQLYYSVSPDLLFELEHRDDQGPAQDTWHHQDTHGFDGATGHGHASTPPARPGQYASRPPSRGPAFAADTDGCDGSVGHPGDSWRSNDLANEPSTQFSREASHFPGADGQVRTGVRQRSSHPPRPFDDIDTGDGQLVRQNQPARQDLVSRERERLPSRRDADPMIAALLSVLLVGTGQIYNREVGKGLALFVVYAILLTAFFPVGWMVNVWAAVDAYTVARRRKPEPT